MSDERRDDDRADGVRGAPAPAAAGTGANATGPSRLGTGSSRSSTGPSRFDSGLSRLDTATRTGHGSGHPLRRTTPPLTPEAPRDSDRPKRSMLSRGIAAILALLVIGLLLSLVLGAVAPNEADRLFGGRTFYVDASSSAAIAAAETDDPEERHAAEVIAAQPTAIWLTPEKYPTDDVGDEVHEVMLAAAETSAVPMFVVYGFPGRDCGGQSAGGLPPDEYLPWVAEIAHALGGRQAIIVFEPDSIALADECGDPARRTSLIADAIRAFSRTVASVYLDGGHSNWVNPNRMAQLLEQAGVAEVRGVATNVSNAQTTSAERTYVRHLSDALGGTHAIIDVSRNGNGPPIDDAWCNAPGLALGADPSAIHDHTVDAELWIKPPGESDGACNGGPPAGQWWPESAISLVANSGR